MTTDMLKKAMEKKVIAIDPMKSDPKQIIDHIISTGGIKRIQKPNQRDFLTVNADKEATDRLDA
jgi:hypothetical protein